MLLLIQDSRTGIRTFTVADIKLYVLVVILSAQDNAKLLEQCKSGFKRTIDWNKYQSKVLIEEQNQYLVIFRLLNWS